MRCYAMVWHDMALHGMAWHDMATDLTYMWHHRTWSCMPSTDVMWNGMIHYDVMWLGTVWYDMARGVARCVMVCYVMAWCTMMWCGLARCDMPWHEVRHVVSWCEMLWQGMMTCNAVVCCYLLWYCMAWRDLWYATYSVMTYATCYMIRAICQFIHDTWYSMRYDTACVYTTWYGVVWCGLMRDTMIRCAMIWCGMPWHSMAWLMCYMIYDMLWHGLWCMSHVIRQRVTGNWYALCDARYVVHAVCRMHMVCDTVYIHSVWHMMHAIWYMMDGTWYMMCDIWCMMRDTTRCNSM